MDQGELNAFGNAVHHACRHAGLIIAASLKATADLENQRAVLREHGGQLAKPIDFKQRFREAFRELQSVMQEMDKGH